jgi:hypothetical protein
MFQLGAVSINISSLWDLVVWPGNARWAVGDFAFFQHPSKT